MAGKVEEAMTCLRTFVTACGVALLAGCFCTEAQPQAHAQPQAQLTSSTASAPAEVHSLKITILSTMLADQGLGEWGFSALVEADSNKILFDTGERPNTVLENAQELQLDLSDVQIVILSHFHHDHTTGLMTLRREYSKKNPRALSEELQNGYAFRFTGDGRWIGLIAELIVAERECCPFLVFELVALPDKGPVIVRVTGPLLQRSS